MLRRPGEPLTSLAPPDAAREAYKAALREIANTPAYGAAHTLRAVAMRALERFP